MGDVLSKQGQAVSVCSMCWKIIYWSWGTCCISTVCQNRRVMVKTNKHNQGLFWQQRKLDEIIQLWFTAALLFRADTAAKREDWRAFTNLPTLVSVVTGASEGIGRAYAFAVSVHRMFFDMKLRIDTKTYVLSYFHVHVFVTKFTLLLCFATILVLSYKTVSKVGLCQVIWSFVDV